MGNQGSYMFGLLIGTVIGFALYPTVARVVRGIVLDELHVAPSWGPVPEIKISEDSTDGK
jgi:hypothetical protein